MPKGNVMESAQEEMLEMDSEAQAKEQKRLADTLQIMGVRLMGLAKEQVKAKSEIEDRVLEDLRAYYGKYDAKTLAATEANGGSQSFVNITRHKCNTAEARLIDMLFPADDKNWSIASTPMPDNQLDAKLVDLSTEEAEMVKARYIEVANDRAKAMERQINDQLIEANYAAKSRDVIHEAVVMGTGIMKCPVVEGRVSKRWTNNEDGSSVLQIEETLEPTVEVVSFFDYFPDMSARNKSEVAFEFERKFLNKRQVKDLMMLPNVLDEQVESVLLDEDAEITQDDRFAEIREVAGDNINTTRERYELWEYHGEITEEELEAAGIESDGYGMNGTVLILNGKVIRVSLNPLETEESPYSIFNWEKDNNSIFGFGVPYLSRDPQSIINASMRMILDNAKISVAPQIMLNKKYVTPADGEWKFSPYKVWNVTEDNVPVDKAIQFFNIPSNQAELSNIYDMGRMLIDEQTSLPAVATGEGDPNASHATATGVAIQSGAAKVVFKRVVKNFDDDFTVPNIKRFYDWNMQNSQDISIKGDMQVNARGSGSLMVREQESAAMADMVKMIPPEKLDRMIKEDEALREYYRSRNINASLVLRSDEELKEYDEKMAQQAQGQQNPEMQKIQAQMQVEQVKLQQKEMDLQLSAQKFQAEAQQKEQQMLMNYELEMSKLAAQQQTTVEKLKLESGAIKTKEILEQMKEQNKREIAAMQDATKRQIESIKASQKQNEQRMQVANLKAGYDTF